MRSGFAYLQSQPLQLASVAVWGAPGECTCASNSPPQHSRQGPRRWQLALLRLLNLTLILVKGDHQGWRGWQDAARVGSSLQLQQLILRKPDMARR